VLKEDNSAVGAADASEFEEGGDRVGNGAEGETDGDRVEAGIGERQALGVHLGELDRQVQVFRASTCGREHARREIDAEGARYGTGVVGEVESGTDRVFEGGGAKLGTEGVAHVAEKSPFGGADGSVVARGTTIVGGADLM